MNANELNGIEVCNDKQIAEMDVNHLVEYLNGWYSTAAPRKAATMLRQQQAEIANLKAGLLSHHDIYPVKELTDEEINIVGIKTLGSIWNCYDEELVDFARAILRKAQEK